jgi:hypothetical protein
MPTNITTIVQGEETEIIPDNITNDTQEQVVPRRSGRVVRQPDKIHVLGRAFGLDLRRTRFRSTDIQRGTQR